MKRQRVLRGNEEDQLRYQIFRALIQIFLYLTFQSNIDVYGTHMHTRKMT
jgi:hypothetical protein